MVYFHEIIDHMQYGISNEDIEQSVSLDPHTFPLPGHYRISPVIEKTLRALMEFQ